MRNCFLHTKIQFSLLYMGVRLCLLLLGKKRLKVFEKKVMRSILWPKREDVVRGQRQSYNEHHTLPDISWLNQGGWDGWNMKQAWKGEKCLNNFFGNIPLGRQLKIRGHLNWTWEKWSVWTGVKWSSTEYRIEWQFFVNTVTQTPEFCKSGEFLSHLSKYKIYN